jgi:maltose alpha-D-glucosyltransferase / alpha-amylase
VVEEIHRIMGFWLELGVSGFRVDAVPYLIEETAIEEEMPEDPHVLLRDMRAFMNRRRGDAILVGEVNLDPGKRDPFFGENCDEMTGLFNFIMSGVIFLALGREEAEPIAACLRDTPVPPGHCQWFTFLRNHDELNLSRLPDEERCEIMERFAPDETMRIFNRGIRRRFPAMLDGDQRRMRLGYSLLLTLPGTPVLWYGEEIGMGDDLALEGRMAVRTPMQWSPRRNGGFSTAPGEQLIRPVLSEGPFSHKECNVADQRQAPDSLLNWMERAIRVRKENPEFGWGRCEARTCDSAVLVCRYDWLEQTVFTVHNLSGQEREVSLDLSGDVQFAALVDVYGDRAYDELSVDTPKFEIAPYGYRWVRARREDSAISFP